MACSQFLDTDLKIDPHNPSFEVFYKLSQVLTCEPDLEKNAARKVFAVFQDEPWGKEHIASTYTAIVKANEQAKPQSITEMLDNKIFTEGEAWFVSHLITTWFLGVYYHQERPTQRVLYEEALMFSQVHDFTNIPYVEATGYASWAELPQ